MGSRREHPTNKLWWSISGLMLSFIVGSLLVWASGRDMGVQSLALEPRAERASLTDEGQSSAASFGMLNLQSTPPGARILLSDRDTGLKTPAILPGLSLGKTFNVTLERVGFKLQRLTIPLEQQQQHYEIRLVRLEQPNQTANESPPPALKPSHKKEPKESKLHNRRSRKEGLLSIRMDTGWAQVYLGRRSLGTTPLEAVKIPAGKQRLRITGEEFEKGQDLLVNIAGEKHLRLTLRRHNGKWIQVGNGKYEGGIQ